MEAEQAVSAGLLMLTREARNDSAPFGPMSWSPQTAPKGPARSKVSENAMWKFLSPIILKFSTVIPISDTVIAH